MTSSPMLPTTNQTARHYETLLAPIYRWMLGDFPTALARSRDQLRELGVTSARPRARALDLGAGLGLHSIALANLGYRVTAVDSSEALLSELSGLCPDAQVVRADLTATSEFLPGPYDVVVCMGDTLTHLRSEQEVYAVLGAACDHLAPGGLMVLTFRDYSGPPRVATDRFLLVHGDAKRILTCCLDYGAERVYVTDIVHEISSEGWSMQTSQYEKLRLSPLLVVSMLTGLGFSVKQSQSGGGLVALVASRNPLPRPIEL